jgi:hypothetical protein
VDYSGEELQIAALLDGQGRVQRLKATDCDIIGPAVVYPSGRTSFKDCQWHGGGGGPEAIVWEIDPARPGVVGAVELVDCSFVRCRFARIGYAGTEAMVNKFFKASTVRPDEE